MLSLKITQSQFDEVAKAKTKHDMCCMMDRYRYRDLPWCFMTRLSYPYLRSEFEKFLDILKTFVYEN